MFIFGNVFPVIGMLIKNSLNIKIQTQKQKLKVNDLPKDAQGPEVLSAFISRLIRFYFLLRNALHEAPCYTSLGRILEYCSLCFTSGPLHFSH